MKKQLLIGLVLILAVSLSYGQKVINGFDATPDTSYWDVFVGDNAVADSSYFNFSFVDDPVLMGDSAMKIIYSAQNSESWGGFTKIEHWNPDSNACYDFTGFDSISFYFYNSIPQSRAGRAHLRFNLQEVSDSPDGNKTYDVNECEYYYSFHYILDMEPGWNEIKIPLVNNYSWDGNGFNLTGWSGIGGNYTLNLDKIKGFSLEFSIDVGSAGAGGERSNGEIIIDHMTLKGAKPVELVFWTGDAIPGNVSLYGGWGGGGYAISTDEFYSGDQSLQWNLPPNDWALWDGLVFSFSAEKDLQYNWGIDSLHFMIKADAGLDSLKIVIADDDMDGDGPDLGYESFYMLKESEVGYDGTWKEVKIPLVNFDRNGGAWDGSAMQYDELMDTTRVKDLKILMGSTAALGRTVYLDDIWTGNPPIDVTGTTEVQNVGAVESADFYNLVIWADNEGEEGESYNVYASTQTITDITASNVEIVATGVLEGTQTAIHYLQYPLLDYEITYYYAVVCIDSWGNDGPAGVSTAITNTAKGIPTISLDVPANFAADGDFTEWWDSGIMPWVLTPENNNVAAGTVTDSLDLKATVYLAIDDDYLYIAADVIDDVYNFGEGDWWNQDAFEFFIGLYNSPGAKHRSNMRGNEPDYKLQFHTNGIVNEYIGNTIWTVDDPDYYLEDFSGEDYVIEARVPLDSIAGNDDARFHPVRGMRIPLELYFHDNDGAWDGNLAWSPFNTDLAWQSPTQWSYTWIGDTAGVAANAIDLADDNALRSYRLEQNYPNPFNPTTNIQFTIPHAGDVTIRVYNMVGQQVAELVNDYRAMGTYNIVWNVENIPSGVYFYQIQSGVFKQTKKMMLVK